MHPFPCCRIGRNREEYHVAKKIKNGKQRTREHVVADLAYNHIERRVLRCGYTMHRIVHDYGLDATIRTFSGDGVLENGAIWVQLKATDAVRRLKQSPTFAVRIQRRDVLSWLGELYPVILVLYDATRDQAHWLHVQAELGGGRVFAVAHEGATVTLHVERDKLVTEGAVQQWRSLKNQAVAAW
jgi:hypothetical protein